MGTSKGVSHAPAADGIPLTLAGNRSRGSGIAHRPAALCALGHQPGLSNDALSRLLDLTHTGTVRLVDRLAEDGLVRRQAAEHDRHSVALFLTEAGQAARENILRERLAALEAVTGGLSDDEQKDLARLLENCCKLLPWTTPINCGPAACATAAPAQTARYWCL
nr:MarR family transcriptional regulator [Leisingera daeponensis]